MRGEGTWPQDCIQRAFVEGAKWWQFHHNGSTMFGSEREEAEEEAVERYGEPPQEESIVDVMDRRMAEYSQWVWDRLENPNIPPLPWDKSNGKFSYADRTKVGK